MFNLLGAVLPEWVVNSFPIFKFILLILIVLSSSALIVVVLSQEGDESGTNTITGIKDTYYSQNKGMNKQGRLKKLTVILSITIAVCVILFFVLSEIYPNSIWS